MSCWPPHTHAHAHTAVAFCHFFPANQMWLLLRGLPWLWPLQMFTTTSAGDGVTEEKRDRTEEGWGRCLYLWKTHIRGVLWGHCRLWQREGSGALSPLLSLSLCNWIQLRWKCSEGALQFALLNNNVCSGVAWAAVHFERSRSSVQTHRGQCTGRLQPDHTGLWWKPVLLRTVKSPAGVFIYGFKQKKTKQQKLCELTNRDTMILDILSLRVCSSSRWVTLTAVLQACPSEWLSFNTTVCIFAGLWQRWCVFCCVFVQDTDR